MKNINVTVWNENRHEKQSEEVRELYPKGIHGAIADFLMKNVDIETTTATLDEPEHGLTEDVLNTTDVLIWWGHVAHDEVDDLIVDRIYGRVLEAWDLYFPLRHFSKIFKNSWVLHAT